MKLSKYIKFKSFIIIIISVSQWGHDFRPQYLNLGVLKEQLTNVPCIALTATATATVIDDIFKFVESYFKKWIKKLKFFFTRNLSLKEPVKRYRSGVFRSNLFYEIVFRDFLKEDQFENLRKFIEKSLALDDNNRNCGNFNDSLN